jgi:hypothetical protein
MDLRRDTWAMQKLREVDGVVRSVAASFGRYSTSRRVDKKFNEAAGRCFVSRK